MNKHIAEKFDEWRLSNRLSAALSRMTSMEVYCEADTDAVHLREGGPTTRKQRAVPEGAVLVGVYRRPCRTRNILDDIAAVLAWAKSAPPPPVPIRPTPPVVCA